MRVIIFASLCFSLVVLAAANDIVFGQRQEGDFVVASRRLFRNPVPGKPMVAQTGFNSQGVITAVSAVNAPGSDAQMTIVKGGPGFNSIVMTATSVAGTGMDVQVDIYATQPGKEEPEEPASP